MAENKINVKNSFSELKKLTDEEINQIIKERYDYKDNYTKDFIFRSIKKFGDRFDYSKTVRKNYRSSVIIICPVHGDFKVCSNYFLEDAEYPGCKKCLISYKTLDRFRKKIKESFPDYELASDEEYTYIDNKTKIKIYCKKHNNYFYTSFREFTKGKAGCKFCIQEKVSKTVRKRCYNNLKDFLDKNFPNYELISKPEDYKTERDPLLVRCKKHPDELIKITPYRIHKRFNSKSELCDKCNKEKSRLDRQNHFIEEVKNVHGDEYDLTNTHYTKRHSPVKVKCNKCGRVFSIYPDNLIDGKGCPCRTMSSGELKLERWFELHQITYNSQVKISNDLIVGREKDWGVVIDFSIEYNNIKYFIEFNGEQHYVFCKGWHKTKKEFKKQLSRDKNVREFCKNNNIVLVEIPWTQERNLFNIMDEIILNGKNPDDVITLPKISFTRGKTIVKNKLDITNKEDQKDEQ